MTVLRTLTAVAAFAVLAACDVEQNTNIVEAEAGAASEAAAASVSSENSQIAAAAQVITNDFNNRTGINLGAGWSFDRSYAEGNRVTLEVQAPVSGRRYSNPDRPDDPLRRGFNQLNCESETISAFLLIGGEMRIIVEGRDNSRIGSFLFNRPCR